MVVLPKRFPLRAVGHTPNFPASLVLLSRPTQQRGWQRRTAPKMQGSGQGQGQGQMHLLRRGSVSQPCVKVPPGSLLLLPTLRLLPRRQHPRAPQQQQHERRAFAAAVAAAVRACVRANDFVCSVSEILLLTRPRQYAGPNWSLKPTTLTTFGAA